MSFYLKSFDFFGKINNNKNFYIFKSTSRADILEIVSKLEKYETTPEFFKHYTNKDIKKIFKELENLSQLYSDLLSDNNANSLKSNIDKYISSLSKIFLLSNLISKNNLILKEAIEKTKNYLDIFYKENNINKNIQKKLDNYILHLLGTKNKNIKKRRNSVLIKKNFNKFSKFKMETEKSNILNERNRNSTPEIKIIDHSFNDSSLNQEKTVDITNHTDDNYNNNSKMFEDDSFIIETETPKFQNILRDSKLFIQKEINDNYDISNEDFSKKDSSIINEDNNKIIKKDSFYTLGKSKSKNQEDVIKKCSSKFKIGIQDEINNINIINNNVNKGNCIKNSCKLLIVDKINCDNNSLDFEEFSKIKDQQTTQAFSSTVLHSSKEKIMLKELLLYINNLFKKEIINFEEKIKLKQLVISKSKELEQLYILYYTNNKDKLEAELKKLLHT